MCQQSVRHPIPAAVGRTVAIYPGRPCTVIYTEASSYATLKTLPPYASTTSPHHTSPRLASLRYTQPNIIILCSTFQHHTTIQTLSPSHILNPSPSPLSLLNSSPPSFPFLQSLLQTSWSQQVPAVQGYITSYIHTL